MGLLPLEFTDCLTDSPYFRENLHAHEKELDRTSQAIKGLIKEVKDLLAAAKTLSKAQRNLATTLMNFKFECIGNSQTDDEIVIAGSLKEFGRLLCCIEDERDRMLERADATFISPIEDFRKKNIGGAKEGKKKFDKESAKFCQSLERHVSLSPKKSESQLKEADASVELEQRHFFQASLEYVLLLQEVQERKKFEFVETILGFMLGWLTFYHQGHEVAKEFKSFVVDLQIRLQRTRENFDATRNETEQLMKKMLEKSQDPGSLNKMFTRQGYLFIMEKKAFSSAWIKHFCEYEKKSRRFTMIPYTQSTGKITTTETITLKECIRRMSDSIDRRFCFDITAADKPAVYTLQALSEEDRKLWLDAMDGKEPIPIQPGKASSKPEECQLDEVGFSFVKKCIEVVEARGLEDQGLYRLVGVNSKVARLTQMALDRRKADKLNLDDPEEWETKTITSALKTYFRNLPEPLMTFRLHDGFISAAKQENKTQRINDIHLLVHQLPRSNFEMLETLIRHLCNVARQSAKNLMTVSNLGVCFGPTLLRPEEESVAAIMDIKFGNVVVEILIENCDKIFGTTPVNTTVRLHEASQSQPSISCHEALQNHHHHHQQQQQHYQSSPSSTSSSASLLPPQHHSLARRGSRDIENFRLSSSGMASAASSHHQQQMHGYWSQVPSAVLDSSATSSSSYSMHLAHRSMLAHPAYVNAASGNPLVGPPPYQPPPPANGSQTVAASRTGRPLVVYNPSWNADNHNQAPSSSSSSTESLSSRSSSATLPMSSQQQQPAYHSSPKMGMKANQMPSPHSLRSWTTTAAMRDAHGGSGELYASGNCRQDSGVQSGSSPAPIPMGKRVRTLYSCVGRDNSELSFEPNQVIYNVRPSKEPGWLQGCLNGKSGLIPENYVEFL